MKSVVLVDDQSAMRAMLRRALERHGGFVVREAKDGRTALKQIIAAPPDVVIIDISMPGMDGLELLRRLRRASVDSKAVILSGHTLKEDEALQAGADAFLPKTTSAKDLISELVDILPSSVSYPHPSTA